MLMHMIAFTIFFVLTTSCWIPLQLMTGWEGRGYIHMRTRDNRRKTKKRKKKEEKRRQAFESFGLRQPLQIEPKRQERKEKKKKTRNLGSWNGKGVG